MIRIHLSDRLLAALHVEYPTTFTSTDAVAAFAESVLWAHLAATARARATLSEYPPGGFDPRADEADWVGTAPAA